MKVPPRTFSQNDRETPSKTQGHYGPLAELFRFWEQKSFLKLGRFTRSFAEITNVKNSEQNPARSGKQFQIIIYPLSIYKSSKEWLVTIPFIKKRLPGILFLPICADTCPQEIPYRPGWPPERNPGQKPFLPLTFLPETLYYPKAQNIFSTNLPETVYLD